MRTSLRSRIYFGIFPLLLLTLGLCLFILLSVGDVRESAQEMSDEDAVHLVRLGIAEGAIGGLSDELLSSSSMSADSSVIQGCLERAADALVYAGSPSEFKAVSQKLLELRNAPVSIGSDELRDELHMQMAKLEAAKRDLLNENYELNRKLDLDLDRIEVVVTLAVVLSLLIALSVSSVLWARIVHPIESIIERIEVLRLNENAPEIKFDSRDEIARLIQSFEVYAQELVVYRDLMSAKLMRSTQALQTFLTHSPDGIVVVDEHYHVSYASPNAKDYVRGNILIPNVLEAVLPILKQAIANRKPYVERKLQNAFRVQVADESRWYLMQCFPVEGGEVDWAHPPDEHPPLPSDGCVACIFQDVTLLKLSDGLRKNVLATVSHELKTPITSARMSLYLLLEQEIGPLNEQQLMLVETARDDVNRQLATIEHLLDLSKVEESNTNIERSEFPLSRLVQDSIDAHRELADASNVRIRNAFDDGECLVHADEYRLGVVLNNFLVNAIKYSGRDAEVKVEVTQADGQVRVSVQDNGPGMAPEVAADIFEPYQRGDENQRVSGTGLGLSISKQIVDAHGGIIGCESRVGEGSRFYFEISQSA